MVLAGQFASNVIEDDGGDVSAVPKPASSEDEDKMASDEEMLGREEIQQFKSSVVRQTTVGSALPSTNELTELMN